MESSAKRTIRVLCFAFVAITFLSFFLGFFLLSFGSLWAGLCFLVSAVAFVGVIAMVLSNHILDHAANHRKTARGFEVIRSD